MRRAFTVGLAVLLLATTLVAPASAALLGDEFAGHETPTATPAPTESDDEHAEESEEAASTTTTEEGPQTVVKEVDEDLVLAAVSWHKTDGSVDKVTLTFRNREGGGSSDVTITEAITRDAAEQSDRFGIKSVTIPDGGEVEVEVELYTERPIGVMVVSARSKAKGYGAFVASPTPDASIFKGAATWADVRAGVMFAILPTILFVVLGAWHLVASKNTDVEEVDTEPDARTWGRAGGGR